MTLSICIFLSDPFFPVDLPLRGMAGQIRTSVFKINPDWRFWVGFVQHCRAAGVKRHNLLAACGHLRFNLPEKARDLFFYLLFLMSIILPYTMNLHGFSDANPKRASHCLHEIATGKTEKAG
jgi:hypothetical protein